MNYLAIDYGTKRIGLARSIGWLAEPMMILSYSDKVVEQIYDLCKEYQIDELVVGISEGEMAEETKAFAEILKKKVELPLHYVDETLSSKEVTEMVRQSGKKMKDRREPIDHFAAAHVLQQFLDSSQISV
jgi:putative Holliday junction resolvase